MLCFLQKAFDCFSHSPILAFYILIKWWVFFSMDPKNYHLFLSPKGSKRTFNAITVSLRTPQIMWYLLNNLFLHETVPNSDKLVSTELSVHY